MVDETFDVVQTDPAPDPWVDPAQVTGWEISPPEHSAVVDEMLDVFSQGQSVTLLDVDHSGRWDVVLLDLDGDGFADLMVGQEVDGFLVAVDTTGDGAFDHAELYTAEQLAVEAPEVLAYFETSPLPVDGEPAELDTVTVTEIEGSEYWFQQAANGLCVPASVAQIVSAYTGFPFEDESAFVALANELGLFSVGMDGIGGMTDLQALYLLEAAGVPASLVVSSSLDMLDSYLEQGHGVMLFVDSGQVWDGVPNGVMDHALVITEIDRQAGLVVLADPGHPQGNGLVLALDEFEQAWAVGNNSMIIGEQPVPGHDPSVGQPVTTTGIPDLVTAAETAEPLAAGEAVEPPAAGDGQDGPSSIDVQELIERIRGEAANDPERSPSAQELLERARTDAPSIDLPALVTDRLSAPETRLDQVTQFVTRRPWVLLPLAIAATRLATR